MYKNILVAIDDSETSRCALTEALHIARCSSAKLYITHVADETLLNMHHHVFSHMADADNKAVSTLTKAGQQLLDEAMKAASGIAAEALAVGEVHPDRLQRVRVGGGIDPVAADQLVGLAHRLAIAGVEVGEGDLAPRKR